jgi:16S rRNA (adenine(1408)-N(1))-methyltransferase
MEIMQGKSSRQMAAHELAQHLAGVEHVLVDVGTGDGRFVLEAARRDPGLFAIGVDACRENLRENARRVHARRERSPHAARPAEGSLLFVIASAGALPAELRGLASQVTVNFPWGSLRDGLLRGDPALLDGLRGLMRPGAQLELRLNASALAEAGWELLSGADQVRAVLAEAGFRPRPPRLLDAAALRAFPSTWARKLAYSRKPEAAYIKAG